MEQKRFTSESAVAGALTAVQGTDTSGSLAAARESVKAAHYIHPSSRSGRGIQDDLCGGFICAYEHDWDDEDVRERLRSSELSIGESFYIPLFYKDYKINPDDLEDGLFMSPVLLKGYMTTFISSDTIEEDENIAPQKRLKSSSRRTGTNKNVTGRSIAYIAVIIYFVLTDAPSWRDQYYNVSLPQMYNFIVDFFESPREGTQARKRVNKLLAWWNKKIFPNHASSATINSSAVASYDKLKAQRAAKEHRRV
ncbi:hypothetical protein B0H14DRAFT_3443125 [Mycena olivaceomarginata]|nr:hypothetical protein B0H14DRAFT_3443125 [Mycena olivaceomarginata]